MPFPWKAPRQSRRRVRHVRRARQPLPPQQYPPPDRRPRTACRCRRPAGNKCCGCRGSIAVRCRRRSRRRVRRVRGPRRASAAVVFRRVSRVPSSLMVYIPGPPPAPRRILGPAALRREQVSAAIRRRHHVGHRARHAGELRDPPVDAVPHDLHLHRSRAPPAAAPAAARRRYRCPAAIACSSLLISLVSGAFSAGCSATA